MDWKQVEQMSYNDVMDKFREVTHWKSVDEVMKVIHKVVNFTRAFGDAEHKYWITEDQPFSMIPENEEWYKLSYWRTSVVKEAVIFLFSIW